MSNTTEPRQPVMHELKTLPEYFTAVHNGTKTFEVRVNDRDYHVGDILILREWDGDNFTATPALWMTVTYILAGPLHGVGEGSVVMGITPNTPEGCSPLHERFGIPSPHFSLATRKLVANFATSLTWKLYEAERKYGFKDDWLKNDWKEDLLANFERHAQKGDPRDVAAYCAFAWYHNWQVGLPSLTKATEHLQRFSDASVSNRAVLNALRLDRLELERKQQDEVIKRLTDELSHERRMHEETKTLLRHVANGSAESVLSRRYAKLRASHLETSRQHLQQGVKLAEARKLLLEIAESCEPEKPLDFWWRTRWAAKTLLGLPRWQGESVPVTPSTLPVRTSFEATIDTP